MGLKVYFFAPIGHLEVSGLGYGAFWNMAF